MHSIGGFLAPLFISSLLAVSFLTRSQNIVFASFFVSMILIVFIVKQSVKLPNVSEYTNKENRKINISFLSSQNISSAILVFLSLMIYIGIEITVATYLVLFEKLSLHTTGICLSLYWLLIFVGRLIGAKYLKNSNQVFTIVSVCFIGMLMLITGTLFSKKNHTNACFMWAY